MALLTPHVSPQRRQGQPFTYAAAIFCLLWLLPAANASDAPSAQPPVANRPANFRNAIGSFKVTMHAAPTELRSEDSLVLTVRITGHGNLRDLERPDLRKVRS